MFGGMARRDLSAEFCDRPRCVQHSAQPRHCRNIRGLHSQPTSPDWYRSRRDLPCRALPAFGFIPNSGPLCRHRRYPDDPADSFLPILRRGAARRFACANGLGSKHFQRQSSPCFFRPPAPHFCGLGKCCPLALHCRDVSHCPRVLRRTANRMKVSIGDGPTRYWETEGFRLRILLSLDFTLTNSPLL